MVGLGTEEVEASSHWRVWRSIEMRYPRYSYGYVRTCVEWTATHCSQLCLTRGFLLCSNSARRCREVP